MIKQYGRLLWWGLIANPLRTFFLLLTIIGSLTTFSSTEASMRDLANKANDLLRMFPYDLQVTGETAFTANDDYRTLPGVRSVERIYHCKVTIDTTPIEAIVPLNAGTLLKIEYSQGRAPEHEDEIAIDQRLAVRSMISLGDRVELFLTPSRDMFSAGDKVTPGEIKYFTVCGIANSKSEASAFLTEGGLKQIHPHPEKAASLLIVRDGTVPSEQLRDAIRNIDRMLTFTIPELEINNDIVLSMTKALTRMISLIMLTASAGGFYMLLRLGQRERLYDLGVMRAVGLSGGQLTLLLTLEGILLMVIGGALGGVLLLILAPGNLGSFVQQNIAPMLTLFGLLFIIVLYTAITTQGRSVITMLREGR